MVCSRCGFPAVQRPSAPCRCPLRATATCMSASAQADSRSAARHQSRPAPRCAFDGGFDRAGGPAAAPSARSATAQGPPAPTSGPPLSSRPPLGAGAPSAARLAANLAQMGPIYVVCLKIRKWKMRGPQPRPDFRMRAAGPGTRVRGPRSRNSRSRGNPKGPRSPEVQADPKPASHRPTAGRQRRSCALSRFAAAATGRAVLRASGAP